MGRGLDPNASEGGLHVIPSARAEFPSVHNRVVDADLPLILMFPFRELRRGARWIRCWMTLLYSDCALMDCSSSISRAGLAATGCVDARTFSLHRLPGVFVVGYEREAISDFGTRSYAKLLSEFLEPLGRVVFGARVVVAGPYSKPADVVGPFFIVATAGASFAADACAEDADLVAAELSTSGIRELAEGVFWGCTSLSGMSFPPELAAIGGCCFFGCRRLAVVDLASTGLTILNIAVFGGTGVLRVSMPPGLCEIDRSAFLATALPVLDLSLCGSLTATKVRMFSNDTLEFGELRLPAQGFADLAGVFLPGSRIELLYADFSDAEVESLLPRLKEWGIHRLRIVSSQLNAPFDWTAPEARPRSMTDPTAVSAPAAVTMTGWRPMPKAELRLVRSLDLSALQIAEFPPGSTVEGSVFLESTVLPCGLRVLPSMFFAGCCRLSRIDTSGCTSLEIIESAACIGCRSLRAFKFPQAMRVVYHAFPGTAITCLDLSETAAERVHVERMMFLERLVVPRRCTLHCAVVPALSCVTLAALTSDCDGPFRPRRVRFEILKSPASPKLCDGRVHAELASVHSRESIPSFPP